MIDPDWPSNVDWNNLEAYLRQTVQLRMPTFSKECQEFTVQVFARAYRTAAEKGLDIQNILLNHLSFQMFWFSNWFPRYVGYDRKKFFEEMALSLQIISESMKMLYQHQFAPEEKP